VIVAIVVVFWMCGAVTQAQQPAKIHKLGWLGARTPAPGSGSELLWREFSKLGHVDGKNIAMEYRYANNQLDRLPALAGELVSLKVDVLLTPNISAALALKNATRTIPIVFFGAGDPVATGLVDSLARPGGNVTGFTNFGEVLAGKRLELLKETIPKLSRVAVLWNPQDQSSAQEWHESQLAARELGLRLHSMEVSSADKLDGAFKEATKARSAALSVASSPLAVSSQNRIVDLAAKNRLPAIYYREVFIASGGLMSYGPDRAEPYRRAAVMVDKILKGTKPADIPVEQPMRFEFIVNLNAAKQIGLTIPPNVLVRAQKVIR